MKPTLKILMAAIWLGLICSGMAVLLNYSYTAGADVGAVPAVWPAKSAVSFSVDQPTVVLFLHPECPCSRATVTEFAQFMAKAKNRVKANVWLVQPKGAPRNWLDTDLCSSVRLIPGADVRVDYAGREAELFHATTSGQVDAYGIDGRLEFHGGITDSRGHEGDNNGLSSILSVAEGRLPDRAATPVFGCSLTKQTARCGATNYVKSGF